MQEFVAGISHHESKRSYTKSLQVRQISCAWRSDLTIAFRIKLVTLFKCQAKISSNENTKWGHFNMKK